MPYPTNASRTRRRVGFILLCWFVPALAAFANVLVLKAKERPPLRLTVPVKQTASEQITNPNSNDAIFLATLQGETRFVNERPAQLKVQVYDRTFIYEPAYKIKIFCDGTYYDSLFRAVANTRPLPVGKHTYRIVAEMNLMTRSLSANISEMTILVEYPPKTMSSQWLSFLCVAFVAVGAFHLTRVRNP